jgi:hypothetical protein
MVHDPNLSIVPNFYKIQKTVESASLERNKVAENHASWNEEWAS